MTRALIVGISRFAQLERGHLHGPTHNAVAFAAALLAAPGSLFHDDSVFIELDPTLERFEQVFGEFLDGADRDDDEDILIFLSTHARPASADESDLHLYFSNSRETTGAPEHSLRLTHVLERLNSALALRVCLILEACHSGVLTAEWPERIKFKSRRFLIASCPSNEESPGARLTAESVTAFTPFGRYLTDALLDRATTSSTGYVTAEDLVRMINDRSPSGADLWGPIPEVKYRSTGKPDEHFALAACNLDVATPTPVWAEPDAQSPDVRMPDVQMPDVQMPDDAAQPPGRPVEIDTELLTAAWEREWRLRLVRRHRPRSVPLSLATGSLFEASAVVERRVHVTEKGKIMTWRGFDSIRRGGRPDAQVDGLAVFSDAAANWIDPARWRSVDCPACDKTGRVKGCPSGCLDGFVTLKHIETCQTCSGTGNRMVTREATCASCGGDGYVDPPPLVDQLGPRAVTIIEPDLRPRATLSDAGYVDVTRLLRQPPAGPPVVLTNLRQVCRHCKGMGRTPRLESRACRDCHGLKSLTTEEEVHCETCRGTGTRRCEQCDGKRSVPRARVHRVAIDRSTVTLAERTVLELGRVSAEAKGSTVTVRDGASRTSVNLRPGSTRRLAGPAAASFLAAGGTKLLALESVDEALRVRERTVELEAKVVDVAAVTYAAEGGHFQRAVVFSAVDVVFPAALAEARRVIRDVTIGAGGLLVALVVLLAR